VVERARRTRRKPFNVWKVDVTVLATLQGLYYVVSGLWAIVHIESFQKVTGPKTDLWLVKTVGLLLAVIGAGLLLAAYRQQFDPALILIAMGSAAALLTIELVYVAKRTISRIYLLDAAIEAVLIAWWAVIAL
jgi:energy-converting hydrogenase Eha subunit E